MRNTQKKKHDVSTHILITAHTHHPYALVQRTHPNIIFFFSDFPSFLALSGSLGLTGLTVLPSPPPALSLSGRVRVGRGLLSLLMRPDSAMSTPLSSLSVCPLSES